MQNKGEQTKMMAPGIMIGFLAGLSTGAILGLLFAPKKGTEVRQQLKDRAMAARNKMQAQMATQKNKLKSKAEETTGQAAEKVEGESPIPR